jgi:activating signal cointegrator 1
MKALTISQPWADFIKRGAKFVENRRWYTFYRGPLAIHAGKGTQYMSVQDMQEADLPTGVIVATAELVGCMYLPAIKAAGPSKKQLLDGNSKITFQQILEHPYTEGPYCWILDNIVALQAPVPATGKQGLWEFPDYQLERALDD